MTVYEYNIQNNTIYGQGIETDEHGRRRGSLLGNNNNNKTWADAGKNFDGVFDKKKKNQY